jgi:biopolymer transport protein ExbD
MNFRRKEREGAQLDMTPLVDVVFNLLIFFMLSTTFVTTPGIKINLPEASSKELKVQEKEVRVALTKKGKIYLNRKLVTLDDVRKILKQKARINPKMLVIIQADAQVTHGKVVEIMDIAKTSGLSKLAIATRPIKRKK